jgi:broad specificity phosphatase PhoE
MKLIITRHGETEENREGIIQGHLPGKLSKTGKAQAKLVALRLKDEKIDLIYSSDLARAADTAKEIARFHPDALLMFVKELRERYLGDLQGKKRSDYDHESDGSYSKIKDPKNADSFSVEPVEPKGLEPMEDLFNRAKSFLNRILSEHPNCTVLFVAHSGINKALVAAITEKSHEDIKGIENPHNTSVYIFEFDEDKKHKVHLLNCIKHLD